MAFSISKANPVIVGDTSALINFSTTLPAHACIEYGLATDYGKTTIDDPVRFYTEHAIPLTGLLPNKTYHYRVRASSGERLLGSDQTFTTLADGTTCPALPADVDTRMPDMTGAVEETVKASGGTYTPTQFQSALDAALVAGKRIITIDAGLSITGNFKLGVKADSNWILVRTSLHGSLPEGRRVSPGRGSNFFKIEAVNTTAPLATVAGAHHWRFIGIEVTINPSAQADAPAGMGQSGLVRIGTGAEISEAQLPHHIIFDRSYIHGQPLKNDTRGIYYNAEDFAVIESHVSEIHNTGADSQALLGGMARRVKILNNYLEAAGEVFMSGGVGVKIPGFIFSDTQILRNYFSWKLSWKRNDPSWDGKDWVTKNHFEIKNGRRFFSFGNVFQRWWGSEQTGGNINIKSSNEDTPDLNVEGSDLVFYKNYAFDVGSGFQLGAGSSAPQASNTNFTKRVAVLHNLWEIDGIKWNNEDTGASSIATATNINEARLKDGRTVNIHYLRVQHNTLLNANGTPGNISLSGGVPTGGKAPGLIYSDNIVGHGDYGFKGSSLGVGRPTLDALFDGYVWQPNLVVGGRATNYPAGNLFQTSWADVQFVNFNNGVGGDYRLQAGSPGKGTASDGTDMGADIDAVQRATQHTMLGDWPIPTRPETPETPAPVTDLKEKLRRAQSLIEEVIVGMP